MNALDDGIVVMSELETAAALPVVGRDKEWVRVAKQLVGVPIQLIPTLQIALQQGRWRKAENPVAYLRIVAKRVAKRLGIGPEPREQFSKLGVNIPSRSGDEGQLTLEEYIDEQWFDGP